MTRIIILILSFTTPFYLFGQEPSPRFIINYSSIATNENGLVENYELASFIDKDNIINSKYSGWSKQSNESISVKPTYTHLYIGGNHIGQRLNTNDIFSLCIRNKKTQKEMIVFFRTCTNFHFGEKININNLTFKEGIFFYDMCTSGKNTSIPCPKYKPEINLNNFDPHKTTIEEINKVIKNEKCNN